MITHLKAVLALLSFVLLMSVQNAPAQEAAAEPDAAHRQSVVFSIQGLAPLHATPSWIEILELLSQHDQLASVDVNEDPRGIQLNARFSFDSIQAFRSWFTDSDTEAMLEQLRSSGFNVRSSLAVRKREVPAGIE